MRNDKNKNASMTWPDKNRSAEKKEKQVPLPWPDIKKDKSTETGNGNSIGNDPVTTPAKDPEVNAPIYDPEKTIKKIPLMDDEDIKADRHE